MGKDTVLIFAPSPARRRSTPPLPSERLMVFSLLPSWGPPEEAQAARTRSGRRREILIGWARERHDDTGKRRGRPVIFPPSGPLVTDCLAGHWRAVYNSPPHPCPP